MMFCFARSLWKQENDLMSEVEKLKMDLGKAEKSLDHAAPGVSKPAIKCLKLLILLISPTRGSLYTLNVATN